MQEKEADRVLGMLNTLGGVGTNYAVQMAKQRAVEDFQKGM